MHKTAWKILSWNPGAKENCEEQKFVRTLCLQGQCLGCSNQNSNQMFRYFSILSYILRQIVPQIHHCTRLEYCTHHENTKNKEASHQKDSQFCYCHTCCSFTFLVFLCKSSFLGHRFHNSTVPPNKWKVLFIACKCRRILRVLSVVYRYGLPNVKVSFYCINVTWKG